MPERRPRPKTSYFCPQTLSSEWDSLAKLKSPGFDWNGSDYQKPTRSQAADKAGLEVYKAPLLPLLKLAPTGFPSQADLRNVFIYLDGKHNIWNCEEKYRFKLSNDAADLWRIMCKDIYNMASSPPKKVSSALQELVDLIVLPKASDETAEVTDAIASRAANESEGNDIIGTFPSFDEFEDPQRVEIPMEVDQTQASSTQSEHVECKAAAPKVEETDDVFITGMVCKCPECLAKTEVVAKPPIASAARGGQSKEQVFVAKRPAGPKATSKSKKTKRSVKSLKLPINVPLQMVTRSMSTKGKPPEVYLMQKVNNRQSYVAGQTQRQSETYKANVAKLKGLIEGREITTIAAAKEYLVKNA